jgi:hypothetical protein
MLRRHARVIQTGRGDSDGEESSQGRDEEDGQEEVAHQNSEGRSGGPHFESVVSPSQILTR